MFLHAIKNAKTVKKAKYFYLTVLTVLTIWRDGPWGLSQPPEAHGRRSSRFDSVIPAQAGIQEPWGVTYPEKMDSLFRGNDNREGGRDPSPLGDTGTLVSTLSFPRRRESRSREV